MEGNRKNQIRKGPSESKSGKRPGVQDMQQATGRVLHDASSLERLGRFSFRFRRVGLEPMSSGLVDLGVGAWADLIIM